MPVGAVSTPPRRRIRAGRVGRIAEHPVGKSVARPRGRGRILSHDAGEVEDAIMASGIREQDVAAVDPPAKFENVLACDPGQAIGELVFAPVLPFRPPVVGIARESLVTRKGEGRDARDVRILNDFVAGDARLPEQLDALPLKVRRGAVLAVHAAEPDLVNHRWSEIRGQRHRQVPGGTAETRGSQRQEGTRRLLGAVVVAEPGKEPVLGIDFLIDSKRELVRIECRDRGGNERAVRRIRQRDVLVEELRLR